MPSRTSPPQDEPPPHLSTSLSGLSRSRSAGSQVVRAYKASTQLYLTRRLREAWETLSPVIKPLDQVEKDPEGLRDSGVDVSYADGHAGNGDGGDGGKAALVAQTARGTRTKVWVFYLSLIHAIVELGAEGGAEEFGSREVWKTVVGKAREGDVWDEIVTRGYGGVEEDVDAEVVVNLATLLLGHMPTQYLNREKLEVWLAGCGEAGQAEGWAEGVATPMSFDGGTRALQARLKVLELFVLHVLPECGEWAYARNVVEGSGVLDEERREGFLGALESLKAEKDGVREREAELAELRERERIEEDARRIREEESRAAREREEAAKREREETERKDRQKAEQSNGRPKRATFNPDANPNDKTPSRQPPGSARRPPPNPPSPQTLIARLSTLLQTTRATLPSLLQPRLLLFLLAFLLLAAKRDLRLRLRRALEGGWESVRRTVGMGIKVSYV